MNGVIFGTKHSYREWGLLLASHPVVSPPKPKTKLIQVPGSNTVIDLTESLTGGEVKYEMRGIRCVFCVNGGRQKWSAVYSSVLNEVHGKRMRITLDTDPSWYYEGRVAVDQFDSDEASATIVITAEVEPYKKAKHGEGRSL
jgi:hypothetical protein